MIGANPGYAAVQASHDKNNTTNNAKKAWEIIPDEIPDETTTDRSKGGTRKCHTLLYKKPVAGSHGSIGYNLLLIVLFFVCQFQMFRPDLLFIANNIVKEKISGKNFKGISSHKQWFSWYQSLMVQIYNSYNDYNGIDASMNRPDYIPIRVQSIELFQTRRVGLPLCLSDMADTKPENYPNDPIVTQYHRINTFLGIDCKRFNEISTQFGKIKIPINASMLGYDPSNESHFQTVDCPFYTNNTLFQHNNPYNKVDIVEADGTSFKGYKYTITTMEAIVAAQGLQACNWLDLNTNVVTVKISFFLPTVGQFGELKLTTLFDATGGGTTERELILLSVATIVQDLDQDPWRLIFSFLPAFLFMHKFFINVFSIGGKCKRKCSQQTMEGNNPILKFPLALEIVFNVCVMMMCSIIFHFYVYIFLIVDVLSKYGQQVRDYLDSNVAYASKESGSNEVLETNDNSNNIHAQCSLELLPLSKAALAIYAYAKVFYVAILYVAAVETFYYFSLSEDEGFASSPLTVLLSLIDVGYLMVTSLVILIAVGGYVALIFTDAGFLTPWGAIERLYSLFLGDLDVVYDKLDDNRTPGARYFFLLVIYTFTIVITIVAFNIFMSIVIDAYAKVAELLEKREREREGVQH